MSEITTHQTHAQAQTPAPALADRDLLTTAQAAELLGLAHASVRRAIMEHRLAAIPVTNRLNLIHRDEVERYRREHLGRQGQRLSPETNDHR